MIVKTYPKTKKQIIEHSNIDLPNSPSCKQNNWIEFNKECFVRIVKLFLIDTNTK